MNIRELRLSLANLMEKQREHDEALAKYSGYSWSWDGSRFIEAVEKAERAFADDLERLIDERISARLGAQK